MPNRLLGRQRLLVLTILFVCFIPPALYGAQTNTLQFEPGSVHILEARGVINPPVADYIERALDEAERQNASLVVIRLDTPGGLDNAMRRINQAILASPVPVAVFVHPPGSRAASAGLFILMASHVAAMAPGTNTGAAHPVGLGSETDEVMANKVVNDAAATIRALANRRGRNAEWAERAVRESVSVTAQEALELNVIDVLADDLEELLRKIDGETVATAEGEVTLTVEDASLVERPMTLPERFLHVISDPNIALILISLGSIGVLAELYNPGALFPGITGVIALILGFFSLGNLPTNWAGVALIVLAIVLLVAELAAEGTGILGAGALVAFVLGALILFRPFRPVSPVLPVLQVDPWVIAGTSAGMTAIVVLVLTQIIRARQAPVKTGVEHFVGQTAVVYRTLNPTGRVWFEGQPWFAISTAGQEVSEGQQVRIMGIEGLTLVVEPFEPGGTAGNGSEGQSFQGE